MHARELAHAAPGSCAELCIVDLGVCVLSKRVGKGFGMGEIAIRQWVSIAEYCIESSTKFIDIGPWLSSLTCNNPFMFKDYIATCAAARFEIQMLRSSC